MSFFNKDLDNINQDFQQRWTAARISALRKMIQIEPEIIASGSNLESSSEDELVEQYFSKNLNSNPEECAKAKDQLLRLIFDNSRLLARSLSKHLGLSFEIEDFQNLLQKSEIPCAQGHWESRETSRILKRNGCDYCTRSGANACDYWREAIDGLVMGLGDNERFVRHASKRHGDSECIDVFYLELNSNKKDSMAWGPLPEHMAPTLTSICQDFESKMKTSIQLKGLSEGVLYFEFNNSTDSFCGGTKLLTSTFQRKLQKNYPGLTVQEVTPRAVLGVEQ
jgi:hypothetical protein